MKTPTTPNLRKISLPLIGLLAGGAALQASTDYAPATWYAMCNANWSSSGVGKRFYVVHDMEGYYFSSISLYQRCTWTSGSVYYWTNGKKDNSSDAAPGAIAQMVRDSYYAWHARCWNGYAMGTEHEGFASNPAWFTTEQYDTGAAVIKSKCEKYGIAKDRNHVIAHGQKLVSAWRTWAAAQGYSSSWINCNTHSDPGPNWNWTYFMSKITGSGSTPSAPSGLTVSVASSSQLNLAWTDNSGIESGFKIERSTSSGGTYTQIGTVGANVKAYNNTGLASGTTYYYRVRAYNAAGNSPYSGIASATTKDVIPAAPTALTATATSDVQINLAWAQAMANEDGFRIYRSTDGTNFSQLTTVGINAVSYSNTGLTGNKTYWYKVCAFNTAGNSAFTAAASDTTAPAAPTTLAVATVSGTTNWNKLALTWKDNGAGETGFKVERGTDGTTFAQIGTTAAAITNYTDSGLAATTTYYYRVRAYNANGNSAYSNTASRATPNAPPILSAIGNKTVANSTALTFTASATDPNGGAATTTTWQNFESFPHANPNETVLFNRPLNSASTSSFIDTTGTNYTQVFSNGPSAWGTTKAMKAGWNFKTGIANMWVRLNTYNTPTNPNPAIALDQKLQFKYYAGHTLSIGLGVRETATTVAYGANGGTSGSIEWVGVTNYVNSVPVPNKSVALATPTTLSWNIPFEPQWAFTGDGVVPQNNVKGVLEHIVLYGTSGVSGANYVWMDDFQVVVANKLAYTLDAGAPAGASIGYRNGKFAWTPTSGQVGTHNITVRVTDSLGGQDYETIKVTVTGSGNAAPVLAAIGNKTIAELSALAFTATATDPDTAQTKTFTLDAGAPSGASINATSGAFTWTPTEAQGPGSYPITVRVTDNGTPVSNDWETITVTVTEVNATPVLATIANQTINEGATLNVTASATDSDVPANTITYSLANAPAGMTINASSGAIAWTSNEEDGGGVDTITVTATDNGSPAKSASKTFTVTTTEVNVAPALTVGTKYDYNVLAAFDELDDEGIDSHNNATLFRVPYFSASTTQFVGDTSYSYITNDFPRSSGNNSYQALYVGMTFKTGTVNPWCRLSTYTSASWTNYYAYPNPTINLGQRVRVKMWSDRSIKVALGVRETGTSVPLGFNGGITGAIEWVGATTITNGSVVSPVPTKTVNANTWTQLEFNLPSETISPFPASGNGVLAAGKGVLEHLAIVPNDGTGAYNIYVDDLEALIVSGSNPITIDTGDRLRFTCTATDADRPAQDLTFSLTAAPAGAAIGSASGIFDWIPAADSAASNVITIQVADNGSPVLTASQNVTVLVNKVNTPPVLGKADEILVEDGAGTTVNFTMEATDADVPAQTITYSIVSGNGSINASTGEYTWTPPAGAGTYTATIRATDNGIPALWDQQSVTITVVAANAAPVMSAVTARAVEPVFTFETFTNGTPNEQVMFKKPLNSSTTSMYVDTAATNYTTITTSFPSGNAKAGAKVLRASWSFVAGATDYWVRLTTANTTLLPNPTINASARLKFDIHTDKALKVGLGIRETGTTAENGANGGTTGAIEYVGCSSKIGSTPVPTRTVNANTWTTLEFDLPSEPCQTMTGNSVLAAGQQVLEHLILKGEGGTGAYNVYVDNFEVVTAAPIAGGALTMKANTTLSFTAAATDPDPGSGLEYSLDADTQDTTTATINATTGAFTWTPAAATTQAISVTVNDNPTNGGIQKSDTKSFTVTVVTDGQAPQQAEGATFVAGGAATTLTWDSQAGAVYAIQSKAAGSDEWVTVRQVAATGTASSVAIANEGDDAFYRIVEIGGAAVDE